MQERIDPAKDLLESVRGARMDLNRCQWKLQTTWSQCTRITAQLGLTPGGGGDVHKDGLLLAVAEQQELLRSLYLRAVETENRVEHFIAGIPDARYRAILRLRYLDLLRWPEVLDQLEKGGLYYSDRQMFRLHGEAMQAARKHYADLYPAEQEETQE